MVALKNILLSRPGPVDVKQQRVQPSGRRRWRSGSSLCCFFFHFFHLIFLSSFFCLFLSFSFSFVFVASGNEMESGSRAWNGCCCCCCCSCCNCQKLSARAGRQIGQRLAVVTHFPCVARFYFSAARRRCLRDSRHFTVLFEMVLRRVDRTRPGFTGFTCLLSLFLLFFFRFYKILLGMLSHRIWA